jgi:vacuolar-type H+-ATPase subunit H
MVKQEQASKVEKSEHKAVPTSSDSYVHILEKIKDAEEKAQIEIDNKKKVVDQEIQSLQLEAEQAISKAKHDGEKLVEDSIAEARKTANAEAEKIIKDAEAKSKSVSFQINPKVMKAVIDIIVKGID